MSAEIQADFKAYQDKVAAALVSVTKCANAISAYDLNFHRSYNENVSRSLDPQNAHLLRLTSKLLKAATKETNLKAPVLKDTDDVEDEWRPIVDVVDDQLEKADAALDEVNGLIKRQSPLQPSTPEPPAHRPRSNWHASPYGMPKPQRLFDRKVDNFQTSRWQPLLKEKPHALVGLNDSIGSEETGFKHPYAYEIEQYKYPDRVYEKSPLIPFTHPGTASPIWVDTEEGVRQMLQELKQAEEIAVDLEHNNTNSYIGIVCLMQISTRSKDWLVDTLKPWREKLQCLNEVFADPNILKVFHGSTSDMIWLQRDLGLYVVGLFDTFHAATALNYQQRSLAHLLDKFVNFKAQKQFQLADWRVRPLPQELLDYARSDTHYLLYIYDCMRNDLVQCSTPEKNLIDYVLENSKKEALQVYERHVYDRDNGLGPDGWLKILLSKSAKVLDKASFGIFRALHEWRDQKAREIDEGVHSIMSNTFMWNCAEVKPETKAQLFNPRVLGRASYYVTANQDEVIDVIKRGKREGLAGPTVQEVIDRNADKIASFRSFKNSNPQAKPQEIQQSIAATMQKLVKDGELSMPAKADPEEPVALRSTCSTLFGPMSLSRSLPAHDPVATNMAAKSLMPASRFSTTLPTTNGAHPGAVGISSAVNLSTPSNGHVRVSEEPASDVPFILGDRKKKRSADDIETTDAADIIDPATDADPTQSVRADDADRLTLKRQQKAAKQARKEAENSDRDVAAASYTPFDYANASSVLHAANQVETPTTNLAPAKAFNPFAKALDTSTGAKRNRFGKEMAGKSHTFSS